MPEASGAERRVSGPHPQAQPAIPCRLNARRSLPWACSGLLQHGQPTVAVERDAVAPLCPSGPGALRRRADAYIPIRHQSRFRAIMPLYYLHIRNGDKLELDPDGMELPDLDAAVGEALRVAQELVGEVSDLGHDAVIEIADGAGQTLQTIPFAQATQSRH